MSNTETGLMKKTKKELIEIILRKDDEEIRLKEQIEENKKVMALQDEAATKMIKSLETANHNLQQHQSGMDELTSQKVAAEETVKKVKRELNSARIWNCVLAIAVVIAAILIIF